MRFAIEKKKNGKLNYRIDLVYPVTPIYSRMMKQIRKVNLRKFNSVFDRRICFSHSPFYLFFRPFFCPYDDSNVDGEKNLIHLTFKLFFLLLVAQRLIRFHTFSRSFSLRGKTAGFCCNRKRWPLRIFASAFLPKNAMGLRVQKCRKTFYW